MKKATIYSLVFTGILFLISSIGIGQGDAKVKNDKTLKAAEVKAKIEAKLADKNPNAVKKIAEAFKGKGFKAENTYFGNESTLEQDGNTITQSIYVQDYKKGNTAGAIGIVTVSDGKNEDTYTFSLEKTGNKETDVLEHFVNKNNEVEKANSWYTCLYKTLQAKCGSTVGLKLLSTCWNAYASWSWSSLLNCIKGSLCGVISITCCTCDCSLWCKWAAGCCDR
jgi:hypothetical protein